MSRVSSEPVLIVDRQDDLLWLTLNDPGRANALSVALIEELTDVYSRDLRSQGIRAVLLRGAGKHFSAGADLEHLDSLRTAEANEHRLDSERLKRLFGAVLRQDALTAALVQGACVAGGCGLATAHDFVVATDDARFMYSEVRIGFVPALVATFLPLRLRGRDIRELLLDPDFVDAEGALAIGLVNRVVPANELESAATDLVARVLERASSSSIAMTKRLLLEALGRPLDVALDLAARINADARATEDCKHGIATFLGTKSSPKWR